MQIDNFKQTFLNQCREEVKDLYIETEHNGSFEVVEFNQGLEAIWQAANFHGLDQFDFVSVVQDVLQDYSYQVTYPFRDSIMQKIAA